VRAGGERCIAQETHDSAVTLLSKSFRPIAPLITSAGSGSSTRRAISSLIHQNICAFFDVGNQNGVEYLVLECVEGESIEKRLQKGPLPTRLVLRYGIEIADALEKAHSNGVIRRDLEPSNIMLTKSGAKLLDFGLAKWSMRVPPKPKP